MTDAEMDGTAPAGGKRTLTDAEMDGAAGDERPEWLDKKPKAKSTGHSLDPLLADIKRGREAMPSVGDSLLNGAGAVATGVGDFVDTATLGAYRKLRGLAGRGAGALGLTGVEQATENMQRQDDANHASQSQSAAGRIIGGLPGAAGNFVGAPAAIARGISAGIGAAGRAAPGMLGRVLSSRPVSGALTGAGVGAATTAGQSITEGDDLETMLRKSKDSATIGAVLGAGTGAVAATSSAGRQALRNPQREVGRTIRALDEAKASGVMETPEFKALPKGAPGFNQAATTAEEQLSTHNETLLKDARQQYSKDLEAILGDNGPTPAATPPRKLAPLVSQPTSRRAAERAFTGEGFDEVTGGGHTTMGGNTVAAPGRQAAPPAPTERYHIVTETADAIDKLAAENTVNGVIGDEHLAKALNKVSRMITKDTGVMDSAASKASGKFESISAPAVKVGDLLKIKKLVANEADYGNPATPETRPYRILDKTIGRDLEGIDPRIGEMNKRYAETMSQLEKSNEILYGAQSPDINRSISKQKRARGLLGRVGDETQAATLAEKDIGDLKALDPKYKEIIAPVEAKKAVERSRFGLPNISRRIENLPFGMIKQNTTAIGAHVIDPVLAQLSGGQTPMGAKPGLVESIRRGVEAKRRREMENGQ